MNGVITDEEWTMISHFARRPLTSDDLALEREIALRAIPDGTLEHQAMLVAFVLGYRIGKRQMA